MLLSLGMFAFEQDTLLFDQLRRRRTWRHPSGDRVGARPASQYAGPGDDTITLGGKLAPGQIGHRDSLEELAEMAGSGEAYPLVDGEGYVYGAYVIEGIDEDKKYFMVDGVPRLVDFSIDLKRVDDDEGETGAAGQPVRS